jgi:hypothetical protein
MYLTGIQYRATSNEYPESGGLSRPFRLVCCNVEQVLFLCDHWQKILLHFYDVWRKIEKRVGHEGNPNAGVYFT